MYIGGGLLGAVLVVLLLVYILRRIWGYSIDVRRLRLRLRLRRYAARSLIASR
jgi:hypothetical protein